MAVVQFHHVSLCVRDLARSQRFYRDLLGCRQVADLSFAGEASSAALGLPAGELRSVLLERDGMRLELIAFTVASEAAGHVPPAPNRPGLSHLTFAVDDLRSTLHSLRDRGVEVVDATHVEHGGGVATCLVRDPEGIPVLLLQQPAGVLTPYAAREGSDPSGDDSSPR